MTETGINTDKMVDNTEQIYAIYCYHLRKEQRSIFMSDISREDEIIGANVKKFRESQGISRKDLAHIFHISEDGVYRIERGETGLSSAYAYILANQLHCDMNFIYGLTTDSICLNMECMDKEQLTPENAISKIRWYTDMLEKVLKG